MKPNFRKHKTQSAENVGSTYSTSSFHSLSEIREVRHPGYSGNQTDWRIHKTERNVHSPRRCENSKEHLKRASPRNYESHRDERAVKCSKHRKFKRGELDPDFIADIIKRQYKPVQMFGWRDSVTSQISEPMCRDREFPNYENIQEDSQLCSCCYGGRHSPKQHRNSDAISVCDARLYSTKRNPRFNFRYRKAHADAFNDSELYDLIPVKEKSSPKTKRKFAQDNFASYHDYREVPPSPRTHRPRLNLKAQFYNGSEDHMDFVQEHKRRFSPKQHYKYQDPTESYEDNSSQIMNTNKNKQREKLPAKPQQVHQKTGTMSSLQYEQGFGIAQNNTSVDTALNNTRETVSTTDKTDRALFEIKDILQSFLQEIKKETSFSGKSDASTKITENCVRNSNPQTNANESPNNSHCHTHIAPQCSAAPSPYIIPPYHNTCCYPVLPMYSMNCMQNGYVMPSPSFTCGCAKTADVKDQNKANNTTGDETCATETDELIKEIYKFVAQSPTFSRKQDDNEHQTRDSLESRVYTSRSAGRSTKVSKHDALVGTPKIKCYSKSCEAIGSRMIADMYYSETNPTTTYTDPGMENLSLEATASTSFVTEFSTERSEKLKTSSSRTRFSKVLQSFGLFRKKKKDAIEELSESDSTIEVEIKKKPPFRQNVTNYMMNDQVYDRPPPAPQNYRQPYYPHDYHPPYNPAMQNYQPTPPNDLYYDPRMYQREQPRSGRPHHHPEYPTAPPYSNPYENFNQMQSQVPLCLKEIEVKSMGTQSERKISFFRKIKKKMQPPSEQTGNYNARHFATQTNTEKNNKPGLWKSLQAKALEGKNEPMANSFAQRQKVAPQDNNLKNVMIKKMFYKRNPFSTRNLLVRTLMGKDETNFGNAPLKYRPNMFL